MNERDSKMIYEVKQQIINALWIKIDNNKERLRLRRIISKTVETFLHPSEERKQPHA